MRNCFILLLLGKMVLMQVWFSFSEAQLSYGYYKTSCPNLESTVKAEVVSSSFIDPSSPAALLRLMFHDCQVQVTGLRCFHPSRSKQLSPRLGDDIFEELEVTCPGEVSCADIIALAARDSVALSGGPHIDIPLGRKDSRTSSSSMADAHIPSPGISVDEFLQIFSSKGMSLEESVAILGAHTLGGGHCINIIDRLYNPEHGDHLLNFAYGAVLRLNCPTRVPLTNLTFVSNDLTPAIFDNQYYGDLTMGKGLFLIDSRLWRDYRTGSVVGQFAADQDYFFRVFSSAFVKLSLTNVLEESEGEIRKQCNRVN